MCAARTDPTGSEVAKVVLTQRGTQRWIARSTDGTTGEGTSRRDALRHLETALRTRAASDP